MSIESPTHRCEISGDMLKVYQRKPLTVQIIRWNAAGHLSAETRPVQQEIPGYDESLFFAWPSSIPGTFHVDVNCGAERLAGRQTRRQVRAALRRCDFTPAQINEILKQLQHS